MAEARTCPNHPAQPPGIVSLALSVRKAHKRITNIEKKIENIEEQLRSLESNVGKIAVGILALSAGLPELEEAHRALERQVDSLADRPPDGPDVIDSLDDSCLMRDCN